MRPLRSVPRRYAATDEAELFAVATEALLEGPQAMDERHPALYPRRGRLVR